MQNGAHSLPTRKGSSGAEVETRPIYIEEWLDSLPYIDFNKTSQLISEATSATNKIDIKPDARLELVQLYNRPYQYYLQSQIKAGAHHTLQSIETMQGQVEVLKKIAINLAISSKMGFEQTLSKKTMWRQSKPPLPAMLMSLHYFSHALIFSFLEYSPTPKNVWKEINNLYKFAEDIGKENSKVLPLGEDKNSDVTSIANSYIQIAMSTIVDPYHLPFGAIWEIYTQMKDWSNYTEIKPFEMAGKPTGYFVIDLDSDTQPITYSKFEPGSANESHRIIDANSLNGLVKKHLDILAHNKPLDESVVLSSFYAKSILTQMSRAWGLPPKRYSPRDKRTGKATLTFGLDAIYYHINSKTDLEATYHGVNKDEIIAEENSFLQSPDTTSTRDYPLESWDLIDQGPGGFSITRITKPEGFVRVGDLAGISQSSEDTGATKWGLGIVRWLMIRQGNIYRIGIQTLAADIVPASIRALEGNIHNTTMRRALVAGEFIDGTENDIITEKGLYTKEAEFEIIIENKAYQGKTTILKESSINFEHFSMKF